MNKPIDKNKDKWRFVVLVGLALFIFILNVDLLIINLALPVIGKEFHASLSDLQWINNIYSLMMASTVVLSGIVADRYGHRFIFLWGVVIFCTGALTAGFAFSIPFIIIGRFLQGIGMGATFTMTYVLITLTFPKHQHGFVMGLLVVATGIGQAAGPSIGGLLIDAFSWRWAFWINVPFSVISYLTIIGACKKEQGNPSLKIHYFSGFLLFLAFLTILFTVNQYQQLTLTNFWLILLIGLGLLSGLLLYQNKLKHPLIDLQIFRNRSYSIVSIIRIIFQFGLGAFLFILPLYLQNIEGFSVKFSGIIILTMAVTLAIVSPISGKLSDRIGPEVSILTSQLFFLTGFIALAFMPIALNWTILFFALICIGISMGMTFSSTNFLIMSKVPPEKKGLGFAIFIAMVFFSLSIGIAIAGYLLNTTSSSHFFHLLTTSVHGNEILDQLKTTDHAKILPFINGARPLDKIKEFSLEYGDQLVLFGKVAFLKAFRTIIVFLGSLTFFGALLSITLLKHRPKTNSP